MIQPVLSVDVCRCFVLYISIGIEFKLFLNNPDNYDSRMPFFLEVCRVLPV